MKICTLVYVIDDQERVLLGRKKRGFGLGKWNGPGGKLEEGETIEECAIRECKEEVDVDLHEVQYMGYMDHFFADSDVHDLQVHVFLSRSFSGNAKETPELEPHWFSLEEIPLNQMWDDDRYWLHDCLQGKKQFLRFWFEGEKVVRYEEIPDTERLDGLE